MVKRVCFASVDVEDGIEGMDKILTIFKKYNVPATLFITGKILEKYGDLAEKWAIDYEIACHSFTHRFWSELAEEERRKELEDFVGLYREIFSVLPKGFRAPSHLIDNEGMKLVQEQGFLYDSSVLPHYPPFKKYRGYRGRKPLSPHYPKDLKLLEIPVRGQIFGIPLAGAWISKLPHLFYRILFFAYRPGFISLYIHSWDSLKNFEKTVKLLKNKNYLFLNGEQILKNRQ